MFLGGGFLRGAPHPGPGQVLGGGELWGGPFFGGKKGAKKLKAGGNKNQGGGPPRNPF